jgi:hypothetical protein
MHSHHQTYPLSLKTIHRVISGIVRTPTIEEYNDFSRTHLSRHPRTSWRAPRNSLASASSQTCAGCHAGCPLAPFPHRPAGSAAKAAVRWHHRPKVGRPDWSPVHPDLFSAAVTGAAGQLADHGQEEPLDLIQPASFRAGRSYKSREHHRSLLRLEPSAEVRSCSCATFLLHGRHPSGKAPFSLQLWYPDTRA